MIRLGLRSKFFLYSNTLIVVTMTLVTILSVVHERQSRYEAIDRRGHSLADAIAIPISEALPDPSTEDESRKELVDSLISTTLADNIDLMRYVIVSDEKGKVLHSNRADILGRIFPRALSRDDIGSEPVVAIRAQVEGERTLEVRRTLEKNGRYRGSLAVGFSLEPVEREVRSIAKRAAVVALILMIGNSALTAIYVETLIRPILRLNQDMKRAGRGDLTVRSFAKRTDEVGELTGAFNRMMDELEEARETEKVRQIQLAHTEKMAAVGTLAAGVAHEVNNPLAGIFTCIENMQGSPEDREMREKYLVLIHDGLKRIERTVANLLDFSRRREMRLEPTSINHNLRHVAELVEYQARKARIEIKYELDPREPYVMGDHFQMEQLLLNLVLNAIQAMPDTGTLTLRTRHLRHTVRVEVMDTGTGIPDEIQDRIFDPFFTTRDPEQGTGLGLAVSDSIVVAHGGSLELESTLGKGSVFRVTLPVVDSLAGSVEES